jgi:4-hydroxy-tetrahydrodipicolinate synthase
MPGCSNPEAFVEVWRLFENGDEQGAWQAFCDRILPLNRLASQGWSAFFAVHKEVLRQRGVIRCATVREPSAPLDPASRRELELLTHRYYPELGQAGSERGPHAGP